MDRCTPWVRLTARAEKAGLEPHETAGTYTLQVVAPSFTPPEGTYAVAQGPIWVTLQTTTPGAAIRYTESPDPPTDLSPFYTGPLSPGLGTTTYTAVGFRDGWQASPPRNATYTITWALEPTPWVVSPTGPGPFLAGQLVQLAAQYGATIRYTTTGAEPTETSLVYTGSFALQAPTTLKAKAFRLNYTPSDTLTVEFALQVAAPTMSPAGGSFPTWPKFVDIATTTTQATVRYTIDRTEPGTTLHQYHTPMVVSPDTTIKAQAFRAGWVPSAVTTETYLNTEQPSEASAGSLSVPGTVTSTFNSLSAPVTVILSNATLSGDPDDILVSRNGETLPVSAMAVSSTALTLSGALGDGPNELSIHALDSTGGLLYHALTVWAGSRLLSVTVRTSGGSPVAGATVRVGVDGGGGMEVSSVTGSGGTVQVGSLPSSLGLVVLVEATGYLTRELAVPAGQTLLQVTLDVDNNGFTQGLTGWTRTGPAANAWVQTHSEDALPWYPCGDCVVREGTVSGEGSVVPPEGVIEDEGAIDRDLVLDTKNLWGGHTVWREFRAAPGTKAATIRYRFQSQEVVTGAYVNDWFGVSLRSGAGQPVEDVRTVGTLRAQGLVNAVTGATPWFTLSVPVAADGDLIRVEATVANAADNAVISVLIVDVVEAPVYEVSAFTLNDLHYQDDPYVASRPVRPIRYLSVTPDHGSYGGYTLIYGTIEIKGPTSDALQALWLEILQGGVVKAKAELAPEAVGALLKPFTGGRVSITTSQPLFRLSSAEAGKINVSVDGEVELRVRSVAASGRALDHSARLNKLRIRLLVQFPVDQQRTVDSNRDWADCTGLDPNDRNRAYRPPYRCGGDSWAQPSVKALAASVSGVTWDDFSNMNGGFFPPHIGHQDGRTMDGYYPGYQHLDRAAAERMIALVKTHPRIEKVCVNDKADEFHAIVQGSDDLSATQKRKVKRCEGHTKHFDWVVSVP